MIQSGRSLSDVALYRELNLIQTVVLGISEKCGCFTTKTVMYNPYKSRHCFVYWLYYSIIFSFLSIQYCWMFCYTLFVITCQCLFCYRVIVHNLWKSTLHGMFLLVRQNLFHWRCPSRFA